MFNFLVTRPFSWILLKLYQLLGSYGLALIVFTLVVKLILLPFSAKSKKSTMKTSRLAPKQKELEKKYKDDQTKYQTELNKLYKEEGVNPMTGCLWSLIPFPILIGLYNVVRQPLTNLMQLTSDQIALVAETLTGLGVTVDTANEIGVAGYVHQYFNQIQAVVPNIINIDFNFLGLDLSQLPRWNVFFESGFFSQSPQVIWGAVGLFLIPVISGAMSFLSTWLMQKMNNTVATDEKGEMDQDAAAAANSSMKMMTYMMPLVSVWIGFIMPAGIGIYWIANSFFSIVQDVILTNRYRKIYDAEDAIKAERAAELAAIEAEKEARREEQRRLNPEGAMNPSTSKRKRKNQQKALEVPTPEGKLTKEQIEEIRMLKEQKENRATAHQDPDRPYARGRAYEEDRFESGNADEIADETDTDETAIDEADTTENIEEEISDIGTSDAEDDEEV